MATKTGHIYFLTFIFTLIVHLLIFYDFQSQRKDAGPSKLLFKNSEIKVKLQSSSLQKSSKEIPISEIESKKGVGPYQSAVEDPRPNGAIAPEYPKASRMMGEEGDVLLKISINKEGLVEEVEIVKSSSSKRLDQAAISAIKKARFFPAKKESIPIDFVTNITISFKLKSKTD
jgi:TonB family protein